MPGGMSADLVDARDDFVPGRLGREAALQRHKPAAVQRERHQLLAAFFKSGRDLRAAQVERQHQPPTLGKLFAPGRGDDGAGGGQDDPVIGRAGGPAKAAVAVRYLGVRDPGGAQVRAGIFHQVRLDIHGGHRAGGADQHRHQRGVVARARADLQHAHARTQVELFEHDRHHRRLRRRAGPAPVWPGLYLDGDVLIHPLGRLARQEEVARHGQKRLRHGSRGQRAVLAELSHQPLL